MNYSDVRSMPVTYRKWFLRRLSDEFKSQAEAQKKVSQSSDSNRPQSQQVPVDEIMERMHTESFKKF